MNSKWIQIAAALVAILITGFLLIYFESILKPVVFGALFALMLLPMLHRLSKWGFPRWLALGGTLLLAGAVIYLVLFLFTQQFKSIGKEVPELIPVLEYKLDRLQGSVEEMTGMSPEDQFSLVKNKVREWGNNSHQWSSQLMQAIGGVASLMLALIFMTLFLLYKTGFRQFFHLLSGDKEDQSTSILNGIRTMMRNYFRGLATVMLIVGLINSIGLWLMGMNHPLLFGMLSSILCIIPYVGIALAGILGMCYAWLTMDYAWAPLIVFLIFYGVQTLEGNLLTPIITGGKTKINPLATLLALLFGLSIWGIAGMIIAIPSLATFRIVAEHIPEWKAITYLIGEGLSDEVPRKRTTNKNS